MPTLTKAQLATRLSADALLVSYDYAQQAEWLLASMTDAELEAIQESALTPRSAVALDGRPYAVSDSGVAVIPIHGYLAHRVGFHSPGRLTGYDYIRSLAAQARNDPEVRGVALDVNSGGGEVPGAFEAADELSALAQAKPVWAIVDSAAYSAAYLLSAGANRIVVPQAGGAGSIGVVMMHVDVSQLLDNFGVKISLLHAGAQKVDGNMFEELSDEARSRIQQKIQASYDLFVSSVAENRGLTADAVRNTEAGTFQGQFAVDVGLVDAVMSPSEAFRAFESELMGSITEGGSTMTVNATGENGVEPTGSQTPESSGQHGYTEADLTAARAEGAQVERQRVSTILGSEAAEGRGELANYLAFNTDMGSEAATNLLARSPQEQVSQAASNPLDQAMAASGDGPGVGEGSGDPSSSEMSEADKITADYNQVAG